MSKSAGVLNPPMINTVEVAAAVLNGALADLERTAGRDQTLPMLNGIILHTEKPTDGENRLYGTSSNRFLLGNAWENCLGALPSVFLDLGAVTLVRAVLAQAYPGATVTLDYRPAEKRGGGLLGVDLLDVAQIAVPVREYSWPNYASLTRQDDGHNAQANLAPQYVAALAMIGKRRGIHLKFTFGTTLKPTTIDIGERYRAMLMPVRTPGEDPEFRYSWPELPERGGRRG
jgi:hypothetical protein